MATMLTNSRSKNPISLTALIDVVFILLMFFMLTSSFNKEKSIQLNSSSGSSTPITNTSKPNQFLLSHKNGSYSFFQDALMQLQNLNDLTDLANASDTLILLPEESLAVQAILDTLDALKSAGFTQVSLGEAIPDSTDTRSTVSA